MTIRRIKLREIVDGLTQLPNNSISFFTTRGELVKKPYPVLHADVKHAAEKLRGWDVEAGMRVGILATNSYELVVYLLALLDLECTSVCFAEESGNESTDELFEKYGLSLLLLLKSDTWPKVSAGEATAFMDVENGPEMRVRDYKAPPLGDDFVPSLVFSSGTTGKMKCMIVNCRGVEDAIHNFQQLFPSKSDDSILIFLPLSGIQQHYMLYGALFYGADVLFIKPPRLFVALKELKPTLCVGPPLLYETIHNQFRKAVMNLGAPQRLGFHILSTLAEVAPSASVRDRLSQVCYKRLHSSLGGRMRIMWTGMAPIKRSTLEFFAKARLPLYEVYGLSESGVISGNTPTHNRLSSVGRVLSEGSVYLLEDGEIVVHGDNLPTIGYFNGNGDQPNSTYIKPNTVATGDIGRFDEDGYLYLVGRKKDLIITNQGHKLHPETLEGQINQSPDVEHSVVFGNDLPYVVAVVSAQAPITDEVKSRIESHIDNINATLPAAGRIIRFFITDEQFTLQNGFMTRTLKLNRAALFNRFANELI
jgi:long-subunit acyl-CoA synthetase (AMP-forming)